tara:strand:- start:15 stop:566 length:552 start_codon:yes stop_codon:yes gene_type:complete
MLFGGEELFNNYVLSLTSLKPLVRFIEVILTIIFVSHIYNGYRLYFENKKAKPIVNKIKPGVDTATLNSRTMAVSGSIIFIFLVVHLQTFWYSFQKIHGVDANYFEIVMDSKIGFNNPLIASFYILALGLLAMHLRHGFQSAFQTFGLADFRYKRIIEMIAILFWLIIPITFISIPLYFGFIK